MFAPIQANKPFRVSPFALIGLLFFGQPIILSISGFIFSNQSKKHSFDFRWKRDERIHSIRPMVSLSSPWVVLLTALFYTQAHAFCFDEAGAMYGVSPLLLKAVAQVESNMRPHAVNSTHTASTQSQDIGLMQINTRWLRRNPIKSLGYTEAHLYDACTSVKLGAWVLANNFTRYGSSWEAVGAYNAACTRLKGDACRRARNGYAWKVYRAMRKSS